MHNPFAREYDSGHHRGYMKAMNEVIAYLTTIDCEQTKTEILRDISKFCMEARS